MSATSVLLLPHAPASVGLARRRLGAELDAAGVLDTVIDDAILIISELLSNALRHARPLPSGDVRVAWRMSEDGRVEVAVSDGGGTTEPRISHTSLSALGGRGLGIVDQLSERWGVRNECDGTSVWAILVDGTVISVRREDTRLRPNHELGPVLG